MTVAEIRNNIIYNENLINQLYDEKRLIEQKIDELEKLREKFSVLQNNFESKQNTRIQGLSRFTRIIVNNKIFSSYHSGMSSLLKGHQFNQTYDGLTLAKQKINKELNGLIQDLENCEESISYRKYRKAYWQEQLRIALSEVEG